MKFWTLFGIFYFACLGCLLAKLVDFHVISPEEEHMMEQAQKSHENERAMETLLDENKSEEERRDALRTLVDNGAYS